MITSEKVCEFVQERGGGVSLVELIRHFGNEGEGENAFMLKDRNVVFWGGMSDELIQAIIEARKDRKIIDRPSTPLVYLVDGGISSLPLAKRPPKTGYKKLHWLPIVYWTPKQLEKIN